MDFPKRSVVAYETEDREPSFQAMQKICAAFPYYTLYLMHDKMPVTTSDDQITPQEKVLRDLPIAEKNAWDYGYGWMISTKFQEWEGWD